MEPPQSRCLETVLGSPLRMLVRLLLFQLEFRSTSYSDPRSLLVPLFVTAVTWTPLARPYSGWYPPGRTRTSAIDSGFRISIPTLLPGLLVDPPSITTLESPPPP